MNAILTFVTVRITDTQKQKLILPRRSCVPVVALVHEVHLQREALARDAVLGAGVEGDTLQRELAIVQRQPSEAAIAQVCGDGVSIVLDLPAPISLSLSEQSDLSLKNIETSFLISHNECCYRR